MNIQQALLQGSQYLAKSSPSADLDARVLLAFVLQCSSTYLFTWPEKELSRDQQSGFRELLAQRERGVPVAYLTGSREFWSLDFTVDHSTLIPRPETEGLVEYVLEKFGSEKSLALLDLGTGSGAIAIAIAVERPGWTVVASDISAPALEVAGKNRDRHQAQNVNLIKSDWFASIRRNDFDVIVSNPPYIAEHDPHLLQGDVRFEPPTALSSGETGMNDIAHICSHAGNFLVNRGYLVLEHGYNQQQQVARCFYNNDFCEIEQQPDISGHIRITAGRKL